MGGKPNIYSIELFSQVDANKNALYSQFENNDASDYSLIEILITCLFGSSFVRLLDFQNRLFNIEALFY